MLLVDYDYFFGNMWHKCEFYDFAGIKGQTVPLPTPESFTDPVEKARCHVFWNLDKCMNFAKDSGAIIMAEY